MHLFNSVKWERGLKLAEGSKSSGELCVFCKMFDNRISQRNQEGRSLEETRHAGKPRDRWEEEVWMDAGNFLRSGKVAPSGKP